jgi:RNA polymerase sigma factor (sigma-70 family)
VEEAKYLRNEDSINRLLEVFSPVINKYSSLLEGEDTKQDLILHFLQTLQKMPLDQFQVKNNKVVFTYLAKSIKYEFIKLSKLNRKKFNIEYSLSFVDYDEKVTDSMMELLEMMESLTKHESSIIKYIYIHDFSVSEIARSLRVSRQSINQTKNRALEKLRRIYFLPTPK